MSQLKQANNPNKCPIYRHPIFIDIDEDYMWTDDDLCFEESDFYPSLDDRVWKSNIEDIEGGDNFADYCEEFFKMLEEEEYWDN